MQAAGGHDKIQRNKSKDLRHKRAEQTNRRTHTLVYIFKATPTNTVFDDKPKSLRTHKSHVEHRVIIIIIIMIGHHQQLWLLLLLLLLWWWYSVISNAINVTTKHQHNHHHHRRRLKQEQKQRQLQIQYLSFLKRWRQQQMPQIKWVNRSCKIRHFVNLYTHRWLLSKQSVISLVKDIKL